MQGDQISHFLWMDRYTRTEWRGFVARDSEPMDVDGFYVINTDVTDGPGKHWCIGYLNGPRAEFFDSYGQPPEMYGLNRLFPDNCTVRFNTRMVQALDAMTCGNHCLFFAYHRCRGRSMDAIVSLYRNNFRWNDKMVIDFVLQYGQVYQWRNKRV